MDLTTTGHNTAVVFGSTGAANVAIPGGYEILVDLGPSSATFSLPPMGGPRAQFSFPIPNDTTLCGATIFTQAGHIGGASGVAMSNAQDLTFGK